jgi:hypothetical protein
MIGIFYYNIMLNMKIEIETVLNEYMIKMITFIA